MFIKYSFLNDTMAVDIIGTVFTKIRFLRKAVFVSLRNGAATPFGKDDVYVRTEKYQKGLPRG